MSGRQLSLDVGESFALTHPETPASWGAFRPADAVQLRFDPLAGEDAPEPAPVGPVRQVCSNTL